MDQIYNEAKKALFQKWYRLDKKHPDIFDQIINLTQFLPNDATPIQRCFHIVNSLASIPKCPVCKTDLCFWQSTLKAYSSTCKNKTCRYTNSADKTSQKLSQKTNEEKKLIRDTTNKTITEKYGSNEKYFEHIKQKRIETMLERYGVEYSGQSPTLLQKSKNTMLERYGSECSFAVEEIRNKIQQTNLKRYGTEWEQQTINGKQKRQETNLKRYGYTSPLAAPEIQVKIKNTVNEKYGVDHISQSEKIKTKIQSSIKEKYGTDNYKQSHIPPPILLKLNDENWLADQHHNQQKTLAVIGEELGVDPKTVSCRMKKFNIQIKRFGQSVGERELTEYIDSFGVQVITRDRKLITPYEIDIFLPEYNLAIEYCGLYWHSDIYLDPYYHFNKLKMCNNVGVKLITIFEDEWEFKKTIVKKKIDYWLNKRKDNSIYARKCNLIIPTKEEKTTFYENNHIQGSGRGSIDYALTFNNEIVACITFIHHKNDVLELNRYASSTNVPGGFTKLLTHALKSHTWSKVYTYADKRWSNGQLYDINGFEVIKHTNPTYWYLSKDKKHRIHRSHFRRNKLPSILDDFKEELTEFENCDNNGVLRIWDCGLIKYEMINKEF